MRVLVIDDSLFMRMVLSKILKEGGHEIAGEASNGIQGLEEYKRLRPDFVTIDNTMPSMNGLDAAKEILAFDPQANIIMCTALGSKYNKEEAANIGIKAYIVKPLEKEKVLETLQKVLR